MWGWSCRGRDCAQHHLQSKCTFGSTPCSRLNVCCTYSDVQINVVKGCVSAVLVLVHATFDHVFGDQSIWYIKILWESRANGQWASVVEFPGIGDYSYVLTNYHRAPDTGDYCYILTNYQRTPKITVTNQFQFYILVSILIYNQWLYIRFLMY